MPGPGAPLHGRTISLVTTSDIRYEGTLFSVNPEESTIAVQHVRSFGTEGRALPEVPASNEIYDFIIFRGKDLKDLCMHGDEAETNSARPASEDMSSSTSARAREAASGFGGSSYAAPMPSGGRPFDRQAAPPGGPGGLGGAEGAMGHPCSSNYRKNGYGPAKFPAYSQVGQGDGCGGVPYGSYNQGGSSYAATPMPPGGRPFDRPTDAVGTACMTACGSRGSYYEDRSSSEADRLAASGKARGKGPLPKKEFREVLSFHQKAQDLITVSMRKQRSASISPAELRGMSEVYPPVYHFCLDYVNYCFNGPTNLSDEQQWESLAKALKKHFETEFGSGPPGKAVGAPQQGPGHPQGDHSGGSQQPNGKDNSHVAPSKPAPAPQRPNNTLGDFITVGANGKAKKGTAKAPRSLGRGAGAVGRGRTAPKEAEGLDDDSATSWSCPRCTLRNESMLEECAACGTSKQQAALWAEFPPL